MVKKDRGKTYVANWEKFTRKNFIVVLRTLMEARGQYAEDLKIRKRREAWRDKEGTSDLLIPDEVSEEWRNGTHFGGLEFPMQGGVKSRVEVRQYLKNLWLRLELFGESDPRLERKLDEAVVHIHWLPDIPKLPEGQRKSIYQSVIGYWGDANDSSLVAEHNFLKSRVRPDGSVPMDQKTAAEAGSVFQSGFEQNSILPLQRSNYDRIASRDQGVTVKNREQDLEPDVDANFPPVFKCLAFGLRGIYGQPSVPQNGAIPLVGVESRTTHDLISALNSVPKDHGDQEVNVPLLLLHAQEGNRGIISAANQLRNRARAVGLDVDFVDQLQSSVNPWTWPREVALGMFLLPLNEWLSHPLVMRNLEKMSALERQEAAQRYSVALERYRSRMNQLASARKNPRQPYQPDWTSPIENFPDGINRVFPRENTPRLSEPFNSEPDLWFRIIAASETVPFIAESNLEGLLKMPQVGDDPT